MHPLRELTVEDLRRRKSLKWTAYEPDVLPLWVAEMDVRPAPAVAEALTEAVALGDTGYPQDGPVYAEALASFAADRWGWDGLDVSRTAAVADVAKHQHRRALAPVGSFESLDRNVDQRISRSEAGFDRVLSDVFADTDMDGDGFLTKAEFAELAKKYEVAAR